MDIPVDPSVTSPSEEGTSTECNGTEKELPCNPTSSPLQGMEPECSNTEQTENNTGRSRRRRSEPVKFQGTITSCSSEWSRKEREALLIALKKYGHLDLENLCKAVPTKTPERIKQYINTVWKHSRLSLMKSVEKKHQERKGKKTAPSDKSYLAPLDQWLEKMKDAMPSNFNENRAVSLAKAVQFIAKYEDQPDPSKCGGVDFRAVYEFLFCMLSGFPPKTLDPTTSQFLLIIMRNFARTMKKTKLDLQTQLLQQPLSASFSSNDPEFVCEKCTDDTTVHASMTELLKIPGFNPFNIPVEMLKK
ncbi:uncharacterized protein [Anabrus simplex]|uniref:uncharacterized protein n=1 Tax=Anabrus simplex TaxID=316456 RepID=UPI0034DD7B41